MHKSAYEIGGAAISLLWQEHMSSILEIGSLDVNGSLKDFRPSGSNWVGVDIENGSGVDLVIEDPHSLPFPARTFDLVLATSVFEHDPMFWLTFIEMVRVTKEGGYIYICAPSNGWVHRFPLDVYRFYPDAGIALANWGQMHNDKLKLVESFIAERDGADWNDFCAIFTVGDSQPSNNLYEMFKCYNVYHGDDFLSETANDAPEDFRIVGALSDQVVKAKVENESILEVQRNLTADLVKLQTELDRVYESNSWKLTKPIRTLKSKLRLVSFLHI